MSCFSADFGFSEKKRLKVVLETQRQISKSKVEDEEPEAEENERVREKAAACETESCAICYVDAGKAIRGEIDSCNHYFCFLCIMEWTKTESRCPICRRRFTSIRRPPKHDIFTSERLIKIPLRDQEFIHSGGTNGSFDPYAEVLCNVCNQTTDENLLLLCDLCDSGAHTFCVGLGFSVPEGDWFCHDCTLSKAEYANSETNTNLTPPASANVTGRDSYGFSYSSTVTERHPSRVSSNSNRSLCPDVVTCPGTRTLPGASKKAKESGARTLDRCRNVQSRIRVLRENWNALRRGSVRFSSPSTSCEQSNSQVGIASHDIDKAWKMMEIAKSKQCDQGKASNLQSSKLPLLKASASKERSNVNSDNLIKCQDLGVRTPGRIGMEKPVKPYLFGKEEKKHQSRELKSEKPSRVFVNEVAGCSFVLSTTCSPRLSEHPLSKNVFTGMGGNACEENWLASLRENTNRASSNIASNQNGSLPPFAGRQETSDSFKVRSGLIQSSSKVDVHKDDTRFRNDSVESKVGKHCDAKTEIQSLVKLSLKLLSRDKHLEVNAFKEIARLATHTILAACGLEYKKKYGFYSFSSFVCPHTELSEKLPQSNIMADSCQECFNSSVMNVVSFIMLQKAKKKLKN
ncbi:uncharacterized protein LOC133830781 [Humulus lupulus]|uniref:uncharacterized protein LOC133830781 n=1 Tax=Humulus lupulus TaxID=3486 RepID=UPI002B415F48|nr:uncharacterized protein LOC133830781 [Humulus lupulus]XP_062116834.1 uncharacterized protein LOC133830781 [Humulus lupulus]